MTLNALPARGSDDRDPADRSPRKGSLGSVLLLSFLSVGALMLLGSALALWELDSMRQRVERLSQADQPAIAVLRVRSDFLTFQQSLLRSSSLDAARFEAECQRLSGAFEADVQLAVRAVQALPPNQQRDIELNSLDAVQTLFSAHLESLIALARTGDRDAVRRRSENRMPVVGDLSESLVRDIDALVDLRKKGELEEIRQAQLHATLWVLGASILAIPAAALLGFRITRHIAGRLEQLDAAARALARGEFDHQAVVGGRDEIARLSDVFNEMASRLRSLYGTLHRSEAHFRSLIEKAPDFILVLDGDGTVRYASPSTVREIGRGSALVGRNFFDFVDPGDAAALQGALSGAPRAGAVPGPIGLRIRDAEGRARVLEATSDNLLEDRDVAGVVVNARDITEFKRAEESLRRSETMAAMGSLVAGVAHEVRNPLFSISATLDAFEVNGAAKEADFRECMAVLRSQLERLTRLMQDLLDYGTAPVLRVTPSRLGDVIGRALRSCAPLARDHAVTLSTETSPDLPTLSLDSGRMEQVLENLVTNAIQHSPRGAAVRVAARLVPDGANVSVTCTVEDEGPGFGEADLQHLFEPFFSRRPGGTGLGLSIVQRIVEGHGGRVVAANRAGGGAVFTLTLPATSV